MSKPVSCYLRRLSLHQMEIFFLCELMCEILSKQTYIMSFPKLVSLSLFGLQQFDNHSSIERFVLNQNVKVTTFVQESHRWVPSYHTVGRKPMVLTVFCVCVCSRKIENVQWVAKKLELKSIDPPYAKFSNLYAVLANGRQQKKKRKKSDSNHPNWIC